MNTRRLKVLTIEDDAQDVEILRRHLDEIADWDIELTACADSDNALVELARGHVDLVFVDQHLGADTGLTVLKAIRNSRIGCPVILLTGRGDEELAVEALQAGAADYLRKAAISPENLARSIGNAMDKARLQCLVEQYQYNLERSNQDLERKNREIQSFYHTLSHELKTPLTSAREYLSILQDDISGELNDDQREYVAIVRQNCDQLVRYINDLIDASRIETGKLSLSLEPIDPGSFFARCLESLRPQAESHGLTLACHVSDDLPPIVVDPARIAQVVQNLVTNAIKFTDAGGTVQVRVSHDGGSRDVLSIEVSDTGRGIAAEHLAHVFDRLYQVRADDASVSGGLGLGLNICRELVELHRGTIGVQSRPGEGTTFVVTLPVSELEPTTGRACLT